MNQWVSALTSVDRWENRSLPYISRPRPGFAFIQEASLWRSPPMKSSPLFKILEFNSRIPYYVLAYLSNARPLPAEYGDTLLEDIFEDDFRSWEKECFVKVGYFW